MVTRCEWVSNNSKPLDIKYHYEEWGVSVHDDRILFEFLSLEGAQAGFSWSTILNKRNNYRKAYDNFEPRKVEKYVDSKQQKLLRNEGIVRNRLKVAASVINSKAFLEVQKEFGSFYKYIWGGVGNITLQNNCKLLKEILATTNASGAMSKGLKKRGFKFVGSTICYAFMQATGMVNDHTTTYFRYKKLYI